MRSGRPWTLPRAGRTLAHGVPLCHPLALPGRALQTGRKQQGVTLRGPAAGRRAEGPRGRRPEASLPGLRTPSPHGGLSGSRSVRCPPAGAPRLCLGPAARGVETLVAPSSGQLGVQWFSHADSHSESPACDSGPVCERPSCAPRARATEACVPGASGPVPWTPLSLQSQGLGAGAQGSHCPCPGSWPFSFRHRTLRAPPPSGQGNVLADPCRQTADRSL